MWRFRTAATFAQNLALATQYSQPVYRFFNMKAGTHFYSANNAEFMNVFNAMTGAFRYDGIAWEVPLLSGGPSMKPVYRFFNLKSGVHLYTADEAEKTNIQKKLAGQYRFEGVAYQVRADDLGTPVYRFYVPKRNAHFYTQNTGEVLGSAKLSNYYHYEGVAYYVGRGPKPPN